MQQVEEREPSVLKPIPKPTSYELVVVVDNVRSAFNVGAILRTSECLGVGRVVLCGITPGIDNASVLKAAVGAEKNLQIEANPSILDVLPGLQKDGYAIWALELGTNAEPVNTLVKCPNKLALVIGNERCGVDGKVLQMANKVIYIPMFGQKNSLNVEVSFGIALGFIAQLPFG